MQILDIVLGENIPHISSILLLTSMVFSGSIISISVRRENN